MFHEPVCVKCQCELRPKENGVGLLDMFRPSDETEPQPYQIWDADLWSCPKCGYELITGFGQGPIAQHWEEGGVLERTIANYDKRHRVVRNYPL